MKRGRAGSAVAHWILVSVSLSVVLVAMLFAGIASPTRGSTRERERIRPERAPLAQRAPSWSFATGARSLGSGRRAGWSR